MIACEDERMLKCDAIEQFVLKMNEFEVHVR